MGARGRDEAGIAGHLRQLVRLRLRCPCRGQPSAGRVDEGAAEGEPVGQPGQRSALAGTVDPVRGQLLHRCVVEQIDGRDGDQFEPSEGDVGVHLIGEEGLDRAAQRRHGRPVPARQPARCSPEAAGWRPSPAVRPSGAAHPRSARSPAGGRRWRPTRRRRWPPARTAARPSRRAGRAAAIVVPHRPGRRRPRPPARGETGSCPSARSPARSTADRSGRGRPRNSRASARSTVPASTWACAADSCRSARRSSSRVSSAARSRSAAAAAQPPRLPTRSAAASSAAATSSSGPAAAAARCQARGTASNSGSHAAARARWACRRSTAVAAW